MNSPISFHTAYTRIIASLGLEFFIVLCIYLFSAAPSADAQALQLTSIDGSRFPIMTGQLYALDERGRQINNLTPDMLTITESGIPRKIRRITCTPPSGKIPALSAVLTIDVSGSMVGDGIQLASQAAEAFVRGLPLNSECAVTSFNHQNTLLTDFTAQKSKLYDALGQLKADGGTDYDQGLLAEPAGALEIAKDGVNKRVIIFLTDGHCGANVETIVNTARDHNASIYCVVVGLSAPEVLKEIARQSGGECYDNITTAERASNIYLMILQRAQSLKPCEIEWESGPSCESTRKVVLQMKEPAMQDIMVYKSPTDALIQLSMKPSATVFRIPEIGKRQEASVVISARNAKISVSDILIGDTTQFSISPTSFTIDSGKSQTVKITYNPSNTDFTFCQFTPQSDVCRSTSFYAATTPPNGEVTKTTLKVVSPNGGEMFLSGSDTTITWLGILPQDRVILEYSLDSGETWRRTGRIGKNFSAVWKVPKVSSGKALVRVVQTPRWAKPKIVEGHSDAIFRSFWRQGGTMLTVGQDNTIRLWDTAQGIETQRWHLHQHKITSAVWSPDNTRLLTSSLDSSLCLWTPSADTNLTPWKRLRQPITSAAWSPDGSTIAAGCADGSLALLQVASGKQVLTIKAHKGDITCLAWSPDGRAIATGSMDKLVYVWDAVSGKRVAKLDRHSDTVLVALWHPNNTDLFTSSAGKDNNAILWDVAKETPKYILGESSITGTWRGHNAAVRHALWLYDSVFVVTGSDDGVVGRWCISPPETNDYDVMRHTLFREGSIESYEPNVRMWVKRAWQQKTLLRMTDSLVHGAAISSLAWDGKRKRLLSAGEDNSISIWANSSYSDELFEERERKHREAKIRAAQSEDIEAKKLLKALQKLPFEALEISSVISTIPAPISSLTFSPENKYILGASKTGSAYYLRASSIRGQRDTSDNVFNIIKPALASGGIFKPFTRSTIATGTASLVFPETPLGKRRDSVFVALFTNTTPYPITIQDIRLTNKSEFEIVSGIPPYTLRPNSAQSLEVRFHPTIVGTRKTKLIAITSSDTLETIIQGKGIIPALALSVPFVDIGSASVGRTRDTIVAAAIKNVSSSAVRIQDILQAGPNTTDFMLLSPKPGSQAIPPGGIVNLALRFTPRERGRTSGKLLLGYNGYGSPLEVRVFGTGIVHKLALKGRIIDSATKEPLQAVIHWEDAETGEALGESITDTEGRYSIDLPGVQRRYICRYEKRGYYPAMRERTVEILERDTVVTEPDVALEKTSLEEVIRRNPLSILPDISFGFNEATLKAGIYGDLNNVASVLRQYPEMRVLITGFTDAVGSDEANQKLSEGRAKSVAHYFIRNGCEPRSFIIKGMGALNPVSENSTEAGRSANRRVEVRCVR